MKNRDRGNKVGKIFYIMGKSAAGKDRIYSLLAACDFPEYQQLSGAFCGNRFCKPASDVRASASVRTGSLSDGDPEQYAGKIPVYVVCAGQCDGRQQ